MKKPLSFSTRINFAMSYKDYNSSQLAEDLKKRGVNIDAFDIANCIQGYRVPNDSVVEMISEILLDDKKKIYDDDFIGCIMALRNGDKVLTNQQFREAIDHAYALTKKNESAEPSYSDEEIETFEAIR